ncbi:hypothetical protein ThidrDRAFT_4364 [Thiorhodococcus drewsii AZ1]|uniref:Uncharacterized protein n=1 Tax=Thiorhodococcus drewsii AZ1 TaxID=765913 RepID=G2E7V1_9GAMM|nr:hypothetical protein [Thiorhodococcus drewsii]EGV27826.1 hypothetical protein ThidrDRAFT_4364 [Thiorhodococcus drewsii AZ1]
MSHTTVPDPIPQGMAWRNWLDSLDDNILEFFEERAAIVEHEGGYPRAQAEAIAYRLTLAYVQRQEERHVPDRSAQ